MVKSTTATEGAPTIQARVAGSNQSSISGEAGVMSHILKPRLWSRVNPIAPML